MGEIDKEKLISRKEQLSEEEKNNVQECIGKTDIAKLNEDEEYCKRVFRDFFIEMISERIELFDKDG